mgnify:CR=1 FL=1
MWERKYEQGRWNGLELNILSTAIDGGKRLHVSDIPYAELPTIKVMGSAASTLSLDVVLVGTNSLVEANALLANLDKNPTGELEHPWLGELSLVFKTHSLKINTKRGLVTLSLSFVRGGKLPALSVVTSSKGVPFDAVAQADDVMVLSSNAFVNDINALEPSGMAQLRTRFTNLVTKLQSIASKLNAPSQLISSLNQELNSALEAISSIANAPEQFAEQLSKTVRSVAKAIRSEAHSVSQAVDPVRIAQASMLDLIDPLVPTAHFNRQLVIAAILMNKDIETLTPRDTFDVVLSTTQSVFILNDLRRITTEIDARINEATSVSTQESLALFNALVTLKDGVEVLMSKVIRGSTPTQYQVLPRPVPALALAHDHYKNAHLIMALNPVQHPLFLQGAVAVGVSS